MSRPLKPLVLTLEEREKLMLLARRPKTSQQMALRARIVLAAADGLLRCEPRSRVTPFLLR